MELTTQNFFNSVLPETGVYGIAYKNPNEHFIRHKTFKSVDELVRFVGTAGETHADYWFAVASYAQGFYEVTNHKGETKHRFRTQENADQLKALFLDIDVGADKPYSTTAEALVALKQFCKVTTLPVPTVVFSGNGGLHVYWTFTSAVSKDAWRRLALMLHSAVTTEGLHADPARTKDCASVLRIPSLPNRKHTPNTLTELKFLMQAQPYEFYVDKLSKYKPVVEPVYDDELTQKLANLVLPSVPSPYANSPLLAVPPLEEIEYPKRPAHDVVAQCPQLQQQKDAPEPVWRGMLATLRHCEGGTEMAHVLSQQDSRYDYDDTEHKLSQLEEKGIAPYTCVTFNNLRPEVCHKCIHKGKIKSPISVPESRITMVEVDETTGEVEKKPVAEIKGSTEIPDFGTRNYKVDETGCWELEETRDGVRWAKFYPYPVYPVQCVKDKSPTGDITTSYIFRKHHKRGYDDFQLSGETLMGQGIYGALGQVGFLLNQYERKSMANMMIELLKEVGEDLEQTSMTHRLGWDDNMKSFLLGNKLYKTSGTVVDVTAKGYAADFSNHTQPKGDLEVWKQIANVYNKKGLEWGQVALATAFASPIMTIGSLERAALLFLTGEKGAGKSTALSLAVSVFGNPARMMVNKDDTPLARIAKLGIMSNIAVGFDEMTDLSPKEASELAYQITQGRGKDRMMDGGKGIQYNTTYWSCLPIMSANDSIINALAQHSFDATAQMSRVLEIRATNISRYYTPEELDKCEALVRKLPMQYGTAGDVYIRWVTANIDKVEEMILKVERLFKKRTNLDNTYRFWTYMCTRMIVGMLIAKKLGLVSYDIERLMDYLVTVTAENKVRIKGVSSTPESLLGDFLSEHVGNRLIVESDKRPFGNPFNANNPASDVGYVTQAPMNGKDLYIRVAKAERLMYISKKAIADWCIKNKVPRDRFYEGMASSGSILTRTKRFCLGRGTQWHNLGRIDCVLFEYPEMLDEVAEQSDMVDLETSMKEHMAQ